jgi:glutathione peroxidase
MLRIAQNGVALTRLGNHILAMKQKLSFSTLLFLSLFAVQGGVMPAVAATAHDFSFISIDGGDLPLADYKGKVVLLVNTASMCGFTSQYEGLQSLWSDYRDRGLVVLGVPSDDFGGQELDTNKQVKAFCTLNYGIDFPMTDIAVVAGPNAHPYYKWIADVHGSLAIPRWNFHKHVIDADGNLVDWFASTTSPHSNRMREAIETALKNRP